MGSPVPSRPQLRQEKFDVIVIGGGINGVAIARECARGGARTLLLEQNDFGSGTSSRSTRIIHGGLRYLEHGELGLVRESLRERNRMLREKPHLVRPMQFVLAMPRETRRFSLRNSMAVRAGLWLYRNMHKQDAPQRFCAADFDRSLDCGNELVFFNYEDAQCEFPERLIAEWLSEALGFGAVARNHAQVLEVSTRDGLVSGVRVRDMMSGAESFHKGTWVINASGPWVDRVCNASGLNSKRMIGGVRGSHILLPRFEAAPKSAVYVEAEDGRPIFVIPWNGQTLVGTTEVADDGDPNQTAPDSAEIDYLFRAFQKLFPASGLTQADIRSSFAGVRPLPYAPGARAASVSRRHHLHEHADDGAAGLISVVGGKLTTAASLARECAAKIGLKVARPAPILVAHGPASGFENTLESWARHAEKATRTKCAGVTAASARAIAEWHGRAAFDIVRSACESELLAAPLCQHTPHLVAEAVASVKRECAVSLGDILLRRVPVALGACWSDECSRQAASLIGQALGWSSVRTGFELEKFEVEYGKFFRKPTEPLPEYHAA